MITKLKITVKGKQAHTSPFTAIPNFVIDNLEKYIELL